MNPRFLSALLVAASVHLASATAAGQEAQARPSIRIVTPSRTGRQRRRALARKPVLRRPCRAMTRCRKGSFPVFVSTRKPRVPPSPMAGSYEILEDRFRFTPRFPLSRGHPPMPFHSTRTAFLPRRPAHARPNRCPTSPSRSRLPNMLLRASPRSSRRQIVCPPICFASMSISPQPMAQGNVYKHISLVRVDGSRVPSPFLNLSWESLGSGAAAPDSSSRPRPHQARRRP